LSTFRACYKKSFWLALFDFEKALWLAPGRSQSHRGEEFTAKKRSTRRDCRCFPGVLFGFAVRILVVVETNADFDNTVWLAQDSLDDKQAACNNIYTRRVQKNIQEEICTTSALF
jgi:hypothetical protein